MHAKVEHYANIEAVTGEFTATWAGQEIARADLVLRLTEIYHGRSLPPVLYFRPADVDQSLFEVNPETSFCPIKGVASYWDLVQGHKRSRAAIWSYHRPLPIADAIRGCFAFDPAQGVEVKAVG